MSENDFFYHEDIFGGLVRCPDRNGAARRARCASAIHDVHPLFMKALYKGCIKKPSYRLPRQQSTFPLNDYGHR
jgi:hypothetical protein